MCGSDTFAIEVSRTSMKVARVTVRAMAQGLCVGLEYVTGTARVAVAKAIFPGSWLDHAGALGIWQLRHRRMSQGLHLVSTLMTWRRNRAQLMQKNVLKNTTKKWLP